MLDSDFGPAWAAQQGIEGDLAALAADERVRAAVQAGVDAANEKLARVEQIKKFHLVEGDWLPGGDEITPTMKLKRKPIAAKYDSQIDDDVLELRARCSPLGAAGRPAPRGSRRSRGCCSGCSC